jgi:hypothetical protein
MLERQLVGLRGQPRHLYAHEPEARLDVGYRGQVTKPRLNGDDQIDLFVLGEAVHAVAVQVGEGLLVDRASFGGARDVIGVIDHDERTVLGWSEAWSTFAVISALWVTARGVIVIWSAAASASSFGSTVANVPSWVAITSITKSRNAVGLLRISADAPVFRINGCTGR